MCYSIPGLVVEINGDVAKVKYGDEIRKVNASLVDVKLNDYVVVQAQFIVQKVPEEEAKEVMKLWDQT